MKSKARRKVCVLAAGLVIGCLSPTLPLPPPNEPTVTGPNEQGWALLSGSAPRGSWVTAYNRAAGLGYIQSVREGRYELEIRAKVGDEIALWYEIDGEQSLPVEFTIRAPRE